MKKIDLNVDIGEGFPHDEDLLAFATSANVCCGTHAGSIELTGKTIELCRSKGRRLGVHPGSPDRTSMGRAPLKSSDMGNLRDSVRSQIDSFCRIAKPLYLKPHGAWYNAVTGVGGDLTVTTECLRLVSQSIMPLKIPSMMLAGSPSCLVLARVGELQGFKGVIAEGFADRAYLDSGKLMPRSEPGAVLHDPSQIKSQALKLAGSVDSICLHGDTEGCVQFAELVYSALVDAGFEVSA